MGLPRARRDPFRRPDVSREKDLIQLDAFHARLPALANSLDIRDVLQHLSEVASRIVPHDEANLLLLAEDGVQ
jgi:hypothetical protein